MRESIGGSQLLLIMVTLIIVIMTLLSASIAYTKAFKARNAIINIVQKYGSYDKTAYDVKASEGFEEEISDALHSLGYKVKTNNSGCTDRNSSLHKEYYDVKDDNYDFCIYSYLDEDDNKPIDEEGRYTRHYGVETYMYFELPIFGRVDSFSIPMYVDSYTFYKVGL